MILNKYTLIVSLITLSFVAIAPASAQQTPYLHGQVNMQNNFTQSSNPSLDRGSLKNDSFGNGAPATEQFDAPSAAFDHQAALPPAPTFGLSASDEGSDFNGMQGAPMMEPPPAMQANMAPQNMLPPAGANNAPVDPESTGMMKLQWDLWHKRVAEQIFLRFDGCAQKAFAQSRPLSCVASYTVTRDHRITNVRLLNKSENFVYNLMLINVLNSMNGNPILEFPPGTNRQFVCKTGEFSRNCGQNGFRHTINDNESINRAMAMPMQRHP